MKKQVIRVGDKVEIINPRWIKRIGYNLIWTELIEEVKTDPRTFEAMRAIGMWGGQTVFESIPDDVPFDLVRAIAKYRVKERGFGGNERKIHYFTEKDDQGPFNCCWSQKRGILRVVGKGFAKTGIRIPSCGGYDSWTGEYWEETGGLADCKTHIILRLENGYDIEVCDVKLIEKGK